MRRLVPAAISALLWGCFYPADRGKALEAKLERITADKEELEKQLLEQRQKLAATLPRIDEKIREVQAALDSLDTASRRSDADIGIQMQKTVEDLAKLRGQVETYLFKIGELENEIKRIADDTQKRFTELQGAEAVKAAEAKKRAEELKRPEDKRQFLHLAEEKAKAAEHALARQLYAEFLKKWPKDELTGDAHFGLGESYFSEDRCREALPEYGKVIQDFAKSRSAPEAYLRSSECFKKLKMNEESKLALEEVVRQYPKSEAAKSAKAKLDELDKGKKPPAKKGKK
ncbi:MAG: tetratricopeptide repeat protein [Myxococcales bacterium]|nr:tetratricopeptide repeat protein [Myxococcales bacterium]